MRAPCWGGFFELLVRNVKSALKKCIGRARLSYDELHTMIIRIERIMNSRPLTDIDAETRYEPLTPSHLLLGKRLPNLPEFVPADDEDRHFNCCIPKGTWALVASRVEIFSVI